VNRQEPLLLIAHAQLEWRVFHPGERQVKETTSISEPITTAVKANDRRDHYIWRGYLVGVSSANVARNGKAPSNQPLAPGFAPLHDLSTILLSGCRLLN